MALQIIVVIVLVALSLPRLISCLLQSLHAHRANCATAPSPSAPFWDIFNLVLSARYVREGWRGTLHGCLRRVMEEMSLRAGYSVKTYLSKEPGSVRIVTADCVNIHALLSLQFADFFMGGRPNWYAPLLGHHSIVSIMIS